MHILVTGGTGFIGAKLVRKLLERGTLTDATGAEQTIEQITALDVSQSPMPTDTRLRVLTGDVADIDVLRAAMDGQADSIFHLAGIVSAGAEADFELGYRVNLDGARHLLELCREQAAKGPVAKLVFTSSIAVYGPAGPDGTKTKLIDDATIPSPQTSYGAQKLIGETLIADHTRKGFLDGRALRLPTIMVRTGAPNAAASTWASSIIREPLSGRDVDIPVPRETEMACLSARRTVDALVAMHETPDERLREVLGPVRTVLLSGITVSARDMAAAVERNAGNRKLGTIHWREDPAIKAIVGGWPTGTRSARAEALGFQTDADIDEIVRGFIADDLEG
jgi:nucleoside-diphosphate-sugar epimerase